MPSHAVALASGKLTHDRTGGQPTHRKSLCLGYGETAQKKLLKTLRVKEVMSEPAIVISPEATIKEAARLMLEKKIGCSPVVQGHTLVGLVTETDLLRYVVDLPE